MIQTVLDVGNCDPDHHAIKRMLSKKFPVQVLRAHALSDTMDTLSKHQVDLVLINRKLDVDYSDGMEILKALKADETYGRIPVMIVTNYPEHQQAAVEAGGEYGFGKLEFGADSTYERLARFLQPFEVKS